MSGGARVLVVGSFNVDHVWHCDALPAPGATLAGRYVTGPGGKGFNQAVATRRAGADTLFVCALGDDAGARLARELAADDGIVLKALASEEATGTAGIFVSADGRNSIVIGPGANAALDTRHVREQADAIRTASVVLAQLESPPESIALALQLARDFGVATVLNPAPANAPCSAGLLALADVITPNETEFVALLAALTEETIAAEAIPDCEDAHLHRLCRRLHPEGSVVITLGARGCFVSHAQQALRGDAQAHYRLPAETAQCIDTTGAGDAFNGALCASWALHPTRAFIEHLRFASRYAARSTEARGAALTMPRLSA